MTCTRIDSPGVGGVVCTGGSIRRIDVDGRTFYFEEHPFCGVLVCSKDGDERKEPRPRHRFWKAIKLWHEQGSEVRDGQCVYDWDKEVVPILQHLGGKHYLQIGQETIAERKRHTEDRGEA